MIKNYKNKYYVYAYYSSNNKIPIYIEKGIKSRYLAHFDKFKDEKKLKAYIIKENLTEEEAFKIESACIDVIGIKNLKYNNIKGHHSEVHIANQMINDEELNIDDVPSKSLIIYLSEKVLKNHDINMMDDLELYERARVCWKMSKIKGGYNKVNEYRYVFVGFKKHIITVYENIHWFKAGTTQLFTRPKEKRNDRYEFVGRISDKLNKKFEGKYYYNQQFHYGGGLYVLKK